MESAKNKWEQRGEVLRNNTVNSSTVNGSNNNSLNTSTVNSMESQTDAVKSSTSYVRKKIDNLLKDIPIETDYLAEKLATELEDMRSLPFYKLLAKTHPPDVLLEALSYTLTAWNDRKIRTSKAKYFYFILERKGLQTKFRSIGDV